MELFIAFFSRKKKQILIENINRQSLKLAQVAPNYGKFYIRKHNEKPIRMIIKSKSVAISTNFLNERKKQDCEIKST